MLFKQATLEPAQNTAQTCSKLKIAGSETMISADKCDTISSDTVSADEFSEDDFAIKDLPIDSATIHELTSDSVHVSKHRT